MNAEQKQAARNLVDDFKDAGNEWDEAAVASHMTALLQELVDAPENEPVARVTGYYAGYLSIATVDGRVLPAGTALYAAQPAPSVPAPDGWRVVPLTATVEMRNAGRAHLTGMTSYADSTAVKVYGAMLAAATPAPSVPADVSRDVRLQVESEFAALLPGVTYMDEPDGGIPAVQEQVKRMARDAARYRWLRTHGLQRAWVSLGTDFEGDNFAGFRCEFNLPEPPNLPYEDDEGLQWADKDFDAAIDAAIEREILGGTEK